MTERTVLPINHLLWGELHLGEVLLAVELCSSRSDVTRMFKQNGIRVNGERSQDRMLFLHDLRQRKDNENSFGILLRRGQHEFHVLEFTKYETTGAYASDYLGLVDGVHQWFHKSGDGWSDGWATREWGRSPGAVDGPWTMTGRAGSRSGT